MQMWRLGPKVCQWFGGRRIRYWGLEQLLLLDLHPWGEWGPPSSFGRKLHSLVLRGHRLGNHRWDIERELELLHISLNHLELLPHFIQVLRVFYRENPNLLVLLLLIKNILLQKYNILIQHHKQRIKHLISLQELLQTFECLPKMSFLSLFNF